jgi:hypothetical protein
LNHGAKWFIMPLLIAGVLQDYKVRFKGQPKFSPAGPRYTQVTAQFEIEKRELLDDSIFEILMIFGPTLLSVVTKDIRRGQMLSGVTNIPADMWV